jgi:hypothetical protein
MAHIHAEKMMQYAQDAMEHDEPWRLWEYFDDYEKERKYIINCSPSWSKDKKYRRKTKTININGFEVPEPLYQKPVDDVVYLASLSSGVVMAGSNAVHQVCYDLGTVFKEREGCEKYLEAILSFTKKS